MSSTEKSTESTPPSLMARINKGITPGVFYPAAILVVGFALFAILAPTVAADAFNWANSAIITNIGWYYILLVGLFVLFAFYIAISKYGRIKLGRNEDEPEFSALSWFSMLFAAGMGIGLVFWGVAEPLNHLAFPRPSVAGRAPEVIAEQAINQSYMHWGIHAWAIYVVVGVAVAYTTHRLRKPMSIRWSLQPLFGNRIKGAWGHVIDVTAVVGTLFGVATSLGLGVSQIASGLTAVEILQEPTDAALVILIGLITTVSVVSLVTGVKKGIKWLSNANLGVAGVLLLFVLIVGPTLFLAREFVQSLGTYAQDFIGLTFDASAYYGTAGEDWQGFWTTFYWGWWISWAPFVGVFIARISKGRTVREFVAGVLAVPSLLTFFWFSVMGGSALHHEINGPGGLIGEDGSIDSTMSLFNLLDTLPAGTVISFGVILLIALFFVTSSDSGSLVVSMLTDRGNKPEPPTWVRIFWGVTEGLLAAALLLAGGLGALQTASILTALPFSIVMIFMAVATLRQFRKEHFRYELSERDDLIDEIGETYGLEPVADAEEPAPAKKRRLAFGKKKS